MSSRNTTSTSALVLLSIAAFDAWVDVKTTDLQDQLGELHISDAYGGEWITPQQYLEDRMVMS